MYEKRPCGELTISDSIPTVRVERAVCVLHVQFIENDAKLSQIHANQPSETRRMKAQTVAARENIFTRGRARGRDCRNATSRSAEQ
jgi:hypothetical protein